MKTKKAILILLFLEGIAGAVVGTYFLYASQFIIPIVFAGILCYLASVSAAVLICRYLKGIKGGRLNRSRIAAAILGIPLAVCTVITILAACGVDTIMPLRTQKANWFTEFSYKDDKKSIDMDSPLVKTAGFVNVDEVETEFTFYDQNAYERAKLELDEDSDFISYTKAYDKTEDVWRIEFHGQDSVTHQLIRLATVYLSGKGVTLLIVYDE